ncbi:MAG: DMT family transporter [archaeon]
MDLKYLILLTALISGISIFLNSYAVKGFEATIFTLAKNVLVAVALFSIIIAIGQWQELKKLSKKQWIQLAGIGLVGGSIPFILFFKGLQLTTGTTAGFLHKTLFIVVIILALVFLKEKLNLRFAFLAGAMLLGTFLLAKPDVQFSTAHLLIVGAVLFWAIENVFAKHVLKSLSGNVVAFGRMFFGSIFILCYLFVLDKQALLFSMSSAQYLWIGITAGMLFLYVLTYYNGLKHVQVSVAASLLTLGLPITALLDAAFRHVVLSFADIAGILLVVGSVVVLCIPSVQVAYGRA